MEKVIQIEGMSCFHCSMRVEKALNSIDGISATVNLEEKTATLTLTKEVSDAAIRNAVEDAGFSVIG